MVWHESNSNRVIDRQIHRETRDSLRGEPGKRARRALTIAMRATIAVNLLVVFATAADEPYGIQARIPWSSSRLVGSPDPPLPFTIEKTFTKQPWKTPIYIAEEPGTDRLWIVQAESEPGQTSRIIRIKDDPAANESEVLLDIPRQLIYSVCFQPNYASNGFVYFFTNGPRDAPVRSNRVESNAKTIGSWCYGRPPPATPSRSRRRTSFNAGGRTNPTCRPAL
jgi:hypothetical protein